ncbi:hypothetical protein G6F60_014606 [Rhizopus arrhizus]|nr:hypothetical protein G6F60_014606 [Rhizopus arrhizus]
MNASGRLCVRSGQHAHIGVPEAQADGIEQFAHVVGLGQEMDAVAQLWQHAVLVHARSDQDRQVRIKVAHLVGGFNPAHAAQVDVGEQQVETLTGGQQAQRGFGRADAHHVAGLAFQRQPAQFAAT